MNRMGNPQQLFSVFVFAWALVLSFGEVQRFEYRCVDNGVDPRSIDITGLKKNEPILISFAKDSTTCSATGDGSDTSPFKFSISLDSTQTDVEDCGVHQDPQNTDRYTVDIFTQSLNGAFRSNDRMYRIECDYSAFGTVNTEVTAIPDMVESTATQLDKAAENCQMTLRSGNDSAFLLSSVHFGDSVLLQTGCSLTGPGSTGFRVTTCIAVGGTEPTSPKVPLIDRNGCGDAQSDIISQSDGFALSGEALLRTPVFEMFAFRTTTTVLFTCRVYICANNMDCTKSCRNSRRKRDLGDVETREVLATVTIVPEASSLISSDGGETIDSCQDRMYQIMIISLALLLLFTLILAILFFAKLNKKRRREEEPLHGEKPFSSNLTQLK